VDLNTFKEKRTLVVVPAYNEEANLKATVTDLRENLNFADILVVDDGSTDNTALVARQLGCKIISLPFNLGVGAAVQTGFKYAKLKGYEMVVQFDGDGQHAASSIPKLIRALVANKVDMVIGSRYLLKSQYQTPIARRIGMMILSKAISMIVGRKITDCTSGFRVLNKRAIDFCADVYPTDYPEAEILPTLHYAGLTFIEEPATITPRLAGRSSITWTRAIYYMVKVILAVYIVTLRKKAISKKGVA
jgi:hypothetical protein